MFNKNSYIGAFYVIGDSIRKTSEKFGELSRKEIKNLSDLKDCKLGYVVLLKEYQSQYQDLAKLDISTVIEDEHNEVLAALKQFIQSVEKQIKAIHLETGELDKNLINSAASDNHTAVTRIENVVPKLGSKLSIL